MAQASAKAQQSMGLPPGFKVYSPFPFEGINIQSSAIAIKDTEFLWLENFVRLGDGNLRTVWDYGPFIWDGAHVYYSFYTIGVNYYCIVFKSDGSAVQLDTNTTTQTPISPALPFYLGSSGFLPCAKQWGTQYLLLSNRNTPNDYWIWDGALLYSSGTVAPGGIDILAGGFDYATVPSVTVYGGFGSGVTLTPVVSGGAVVELTITNPGSGYQPGDIVQVAFSGGGADTTPILTAQLTAGSVGGASISAGGSGYTSPTVAFSGGGGAGAIATAHQTGGVVDAITITNPGTGYTTAPTIVISDGGPGTGASAVAVLAPNGVETVTVVDGGSGFTTVPLITFTGGGGAGAAGFVELTGTSIASVNITAGGSGYGSPPTFELIGGFSSNVVSPGFATGIVLMSGDQVAGVQITNAGFHYDSPVQVVFVPAHGDTGSGAGGNVVFAPTSIARVVVSSTGQYYTSAPAVVVGPGANGAAYASISLMPYGVSGSAMETYLSRVWIVNPAPGAFSTLPPGGNWQVSAPGSLTDFATSDGGVAAVNADSFLQVQYTNVHQSSGYLYFFGDGSVSVVSNVSTSQAQGSSVVSTAYNYQNVDPQSGTPWRDTLQDFGRSSIITNSTGVYGIYGGTLSKISGKLDQLFTLVNQRGLFVPPELGGVVPSSAVAIIFNVKHYLVLVTIQDPDTKVNRNVMLTWNEKDWTISSQSVDLLSISTQKIGSSYFAFGSDGTSIYPLFDQPAEKLTKRFDTKFYGADKPYIQKQALGTWMMSTDNTLAELGVMGEFSMVVSGIAVQNQIFPSLQNGIYATFTDQPDIQTPNPFFGLWGTSMGGIFFVGMGLRFVSNAADFTLGNLTLGYAEVTAYFGQ